ncbi:MAG: response regulator transcription factor [Spirochaetales bacterium]|nr:response regulator transcription factor [Spirochaetales bacterium]
MIFYVEDDENIRQLVVYALNNSGFVAEGFEDSASLFERLETELPQVILLDIMLPGLDGFEVLRMLRKNSKSSSIAILMLSAKGNEMDKVNALNLGADDYLVKPFGIMELIARIKAVLRRKGTSENPLLSYQGIIVDKEKHQVTIDKIEVNLTNKEFELLYLLLSNPGIVFTREKLLEVVWGYEYSGDTRTVDVHVKTLRSKMGEYGIVIVTVFGVGYKARGENV